MSHKNVIGTIVLATVALFSAVVVAQQQSNPSQEKSGPVGRGMMGGGMMMGKMMAQHQDMSQLMSKMMQSMTAINSEKDPAKLKALFAEGSDAQQDDGAGQHNARHGGSNEELPWDGRRQ